MRLAHLSNALAAALVMTGLALTLAGCGGSGSQNGTVQRTASPVIHMRGGRPAHIAVVIMENEEYGDIIGSSLDAVHQPARPPLCAGGLDVRHQPPVAAQLPGA